MPYSYSVVILRVNHYRIRGLSHLGDGNRNGKRQALLLGLSFTDVGDDITSSDRPQNAATYPRVLEEIYIYSDPSVNDTSPFSTESGTVRWVE